MNLANRKRSAVGPGGKARFVCPECGLVNEIRVDTEIRYATPVRTLFHCACGSPHTVYLQRRAVRRRVDLPGQLILPGRHRQDILVRNLSRTGILLEHDGGATFQVGDKLSVEFELNHITTTRFRQRITVRRVNGPAVGAEFCPTPDQTFQIALACHTPASC